MDRGGGLILLKFQFADSELQDGETCFPGCFFHNVVEKSEFKSSHGLGFLSKDYDVYMASNHGSMNIGFPPQKVPCFRYK